MKRYYTREIPRGCPENEELIPLLLTVGPAVPALKLLEEFVFSILNVLLNAEQLLGFPSNLAV